MTKQNYARGVFFLILSALSFAVMGALVRLSGDIPFIEKTFFRNLVALVIASIILVRQIAKNGKNSVHIPKRAVKFLFLRAAAGTLGVFANFYAIDHLILSDAAILNKMSPFFALIFSFIILGEKIKPVSLICISAAFLGALLVIKPSFDFAKTFPSLCGLLGGVGAGLAYASIRKLHALDCTGNVVVLFFSAFSLACALPFLPYYVPISGRKLFILLGTGFAAAGGQFGITAAYYNAPASKISIFDFSQILFSAALGFFMFGQIPDLLSFAGYALIILTAAANFIYNKPVRKRQFRNRLP
ncbi:MAG: DMT family transporter [Treponema sp.]